MIFSYVYPSHIAIFYGHVNHVKYALFSYFDNSQNELKTLDIKCLNIKYVTISFLHKIVFSEILHKWDALIRQEEYIIY